MTEACELGTSTPETSSVRVGSLWSGTSGAAAELERSGADSVWVPGHVMARGPARESVTSLARLAAETSTATIGTAVTVLPLYPPMIIAKQIAEIDRWSDGRVMLGVGVGGESPDEFASCQVPVAERGRRTDESIALVRRLWHGEEVTADGRYYPTTAARVLPVPARAGGPPIIVAGRGPRAMRRAGQLGDGWMPYLYSADRYRRSLGEISAAAEAVGRRLDRFVRAIFLFVSMHEDRATARQGALDHLGESYRVDMREYVERVAAVGTPDDLAEIARGYVDAGVRHFVLAPCTRQEPDRMALDALQVVREAVSPPKALATR